MNKVVEFLNANPVQYLATVGRDGKAKCRPFMFAGELDGKLWFCTNNQKEVYKDMQENPYMEIVRLQPRVRVDPPARQGRIREQHGRQGNVHPEPHREEPVRRGHATPSLRCSIWRTPMAVIADFSGNPPYEF